MLDVWPLKRTRCEKLGELKAFGIDLLNKLKEKLPLLAVTVGICIWTWVAQREAGAMTISDAVGLGERLSNGFVSYARYLGSMVWPVNLTILYPYDANLPPLWIAGSVVLLIAGSVITIRELPRRPVLFSGWFWFLGTLVPVIGIIHVGSQALADRYLYMPAIGIYIAVVFACWPKEGTRWNKAAIGFISALLVLCIVAARKQIMTWQNGTTVFERAVAVTDGNWIAMNNLANNYARAERWQEASPLFDKVIELGGPRADAFFNAGLARENIGQPQQAAALYQSALELDPDSLKSLINLANLLLHAKADPAAAIPFFRRAVALDPSAVQPTITLAGLLSQAGSDQAALQVVQTSFSTIRIPAISTTMPEHSPPPPGIRLRPGNISNVPSQSLKPWKIANSSKPPVRN